MLRIKPGILAGRNGKDEKYAEYNLSINSKHLLLWNMEKRRHNPVSKAIRLSRDWTKMFSNSSITWFILSDTLRSPSLPFYSVLLEGLWYLSELSLGKAEMEIK